MLSLRIVSSSFIAGTVLVWFNDLGKGRLTGREHATDVGMAELTVFPKRHMLLKGRHGISPGGVCHLFQVGKGFLEAVAAIDLHLESQLMCTSFPDPVARPFGRATCREAIVLLFDAAKVNVGGGNPS